MAAAASVVMPTTGSGCVRLARRATRTPAGRPPLRLTRRGRIVITGVSALMAGVLSVGLATAAQATRHAGSAGTGGPGRYVTRVVVQPGQSLWSLAQEYAPRADPRQVIQQVLQLNSLPGDQLQPGQVLWLPAD